TAVVIGGISMGIAAAFVTVVKEPSGRSPS
ncbi:MAG: hypothetical protein K0S65_4541, partial [Labilithrix sp.]|nr:hypothetical protein [Labilithrix sp.]